jgi:hypothetical protein
MGGGWGVGWGGGEGVIDEAENPLDGVISNISKNDIILGVEPHRL